MSDVENASHRLVISLKIGSSLPKVAMDYVANVNGKDVAAKVEAPSRAERGLDSVINVGTELRSVAGGSADHLVAGGTLKGIPYGAW